MKKIKLKNLLKCGILLFGISLSLTNCSNDDKILIEEKGKFLKGITHQSFSSIKNISLVQEKTSRFIKSKNEFNRTSSDSITFSIDTTSIQVIESQIYTSYTFKADMFNEIDSQLNNYVLTIYNDNNYKQMLVTYPIIGTIDDTYYDVDNASAEPIDGDIILNARGGCDGYPVTSWVETCETYNCTLGAGCTGNNDGGSWTDPYEVCEGAWVHGCEQADSIDAPDGPSGGGGGGGTTTTPDDDEDDAVAVVPFNPRDPIQIDQHVISLNEVVNIPKVKTELSRLKNNMGFSTQEDGKRFIYTGSDINDTSTYSDDNFNEQSPTKKKSNALSFPTLQNNTLIGAHFHPDLDDSSPPKPIRKVPSGTDIAEHIVMVKKIAETNPTSLPEINQVSNFVVSKGNNGKTYAIRTNDEQSIVNLEGDFTKEGKERKVIAQELGKIILEINPSSPNVNTLQETAIANYITENFPGLSIYVAVYNTAGEIINWIKL